MTDDNRDRTPGAPPPRPPSPGIDPDGPTVPMARPKLIPPDPGPTDTAPPVPAEPGAPRPDPAHPGPPHPGPAQPVAGEPDAAQPDPAPPAPAQPEPERATPGEKTVQLSAADLILPPNPAPAAQEPEPEPEPEAEPEMAPAARDAEPVTTPEEPPRAEAGDAPAGPSPVPVTAAVPAREPQSHDGEADAPGTGAKPAGRRLSSAGALIGVLLALFGFTLVVQLRSNDDNSELASARQEDLVRILSDLEARDQRLQQDITTLDDSRRQLTSGVAGREAALAEADKRAAELGLLSGTVPGRGPGLVVTLAAKDQEIKASALLNAVQELRGAGGEVMQLVGDNGVAVRIVASSYFVDAAGGAIVVDGQQLSGPYELTVIGDGPTMQTALQIPGGVVASVSQGGGNVTMEQRTSVDVTAVRQAASLQYARPVA